MKKKQKTKTVTVQRNQEKKFSRGEIVKKVIFLLILALLCFLPAKYVGGAYGYIPLVVLILTLVVSFFYAFFLRRQLAYLELSELSSCVRGTDMDFIVEVQNRSFMVFPRVEAYFYISDLFGEIDSLTKSSLTLAPKETREFRFTVKFAHIGTYTAGLQELRVYDLLNLFCFTIRNDHRCEVKVNPKVHPFLNMQISETAIYESLQSYIVSPAPGMDYAGVREYVWGDPIKNIHWKLSAHSREYMTKILESYGTSDVTIVMDLATAEYDAETVMDMYDGVVETALSVCYFAKENGIEYDLRFMDKEGHRGRFIPRDFYNTQELMEQLPPIRVGDMEHDVSNLLKEDNNYIFGRNNIVFCTADMNDKAVEALLSLKKEGRNVIAFFLVPSNIYDSEREYVLAPLKRLENARIPYYTCSSADELAS